MYVSIHGVEIFDQNEIEILKDGEVGDECVILIRGHITMKTESEGTVSLDIKSDKACVNEAIEKKKAPRQPSRPIKVEVLNDADVMLRGMVK